MAKNEVKDSKGGFSSSDQPKDQRDQKISKKTPKNSPANSPASQPVNPTTNANSAASLEVPNVSPTVALTNFFKDVNVELSKVVWPSRQQLISESIAVLLMVIVAATLVYFVDSLFGWLATQVFR